MWHLPGILLRWMTSESYWVWGLGSLNPKPSFFVCRTFSLGFRGQGLGLSAWSLGFAGGKLPGCPLLAQQEMSRGVQADAQKRSLHWGMYDGKKWDVYDLGTCGGIQFSEIPRQGTPTSKFWIVLLRQGLDWITTRVLTCGR